MRVEVRDLYTGYGRALVLFGVSLEVTEGAITCVMGRNGVGKTTLLNAIGGLLPLRSGQVLVDGRDVAGVPPHRRARLGVAYAPQGHQVFPYMTVDENLRVVHERTLALRAAGRRGARLDGFAAARDEAVELFPALAALLQRPAGLLSGGQARQLAIARALITRPRTLMLDEPTEGIQPSIVDEIEAAIAERHRSTGMTVLVVEQYVEMALRLAHRYAVMDRGRIVKEGETASADASTFADLLAL